MPTITLTLQSVMSHLDAFSVTKYSFLEASYPDMPRKFIMRCYLSVVVVKKNSPSRIIWIVTGKLCIRVIKNPVTNVVRNSRELIM